ncbi:MAG TPA: N-acetylmuramoyl-L-alanine amidase [Vicinamibacterales bacterium]|nr:N-acetylmuramoyl-L-alanine amidase [Vicinamibacterales bacterium]
MRIRSGRPLWLALLLVVVTWTIAAQAPQTPAPYTVISREGRRPLPTRTISGQEMFAVDDLVKLFGLTAHEDTIAGGLTLTVRGQSIVLTPGQDIASVAGRLISLPAPPARDGRAWFVPVDFVQRALAPVAATRIELRKPSRLVLVGDIRMPRVAARIDPAGNVARLTFDVAPATPHTVAQDGARILLRFDADAIDATLPPTTAPELIAAVRPEGAAAVAIEPGPRFASFRTSETPGPSGAARIVIEVVGRTTEAVTPPTGATPPPEPPPLLDLVPAGTLRTVVIDPGHGGADEGARGPAGSAEKHVTLAIARRLKGALEARLGVRVILTREGDAAVGLDERAAVANNNKADLFISLHANASVRPVASGAEVFYLSLQEYGDEALRAANAPREALPVFGGGARDIEVVPWRFAQARHIEQSAAFARAAETALRGRVPMTPRALQQAPFRVLAGANMPAVLVEVGFMTNAAQETQLNSDAYQNDIVQALVDAVVQFRDRRGGPSAAAGAGR